MCPLHRRRRRRSGHSLRQPCIGPCLAALLCATLQHCHPWWLVVVVARQWSDPLLSLPPLPPCRSCDASFKGKSGELVLTGSTRLNDPYAVCYSQFTVAVGNDCALTVTPAAFAADLKYKNTVGGWQAVFGGQAGWPCGHACSKTCSPPHSLLNASYTPLMTFAPLPPLPCRRPAPPAP